MGRDLIRALELPVWIGRSLIAAFASLEESQPGGASVVERLREASVVTRLPLQRFILLSMLRIEPLAKDEWLVTVTGTTTTQHRVRVTPADLHRFGAGATVEQLLEASFRFLLAREPNTSILPSFDLPAIERYFPEYPTEIARLLKTPP